MAVRPGPTTTQADLDKLGFSSDKIKSKLMQMRGGTLTEVHINDPFCNFQQWRLQNAVLGPPITVSTTPTDTECVRTLHHYDNSMNQQVASLAVFHTRTNALREGVEMEAPPVIKLDAQIEFPSQAKDLNLLPKLDTPVPILDTEEASGFRFTSQDDASLYFDLRIEAGESVDLWEITSEIGSNIKLEVPYGFQGKVGTHGRVWQEREDWAFGFSTVFPDPPQKLKVIHAARLTKTTYMLRPGKAQVVPQRSADWHPTSTVIVTDVSRQVAQEFRLGEAIIL